MRTLIRLLLGELSGQGIVLAVAEGIRKSHGAMSFRNQL